MLLHLNHQILDLLPKTIPIQIRLQQLRGMLIIMQTSIIKAEILPFPLQKADVKNNTIILIEFCLPLISSNYK